MTKKIGNPNELDDSLVQFTVVDEHEMQCATCTWRGFQHGMPDTQCAIYKRKPTGVIIKDPEYLCPAYLKEDLE